MNHTPHNPTIRITKAERDEALNSADRAMKAFREHQKENGIVHLAKQPRQSSGDTTSNAAHYSWSP